MSPLRQLAGQIGVGVAFLATSMLIARLLSLLNLAVLARLLTPDDYGVIAAAMFMLGLAELATSLPISAALIRSEKFDEPALHTAFTLSLARGLLIAAIVYLSAEWIAALFADHRITAVLHWLALSPLLFGLQNPKFILYERRMDFRWAAGVEVAAAVAATVVAVVFALAMRNYWALVAAAVAQRLTHVALSYLFLPFVPSIGFARTGEFLRFGGWITAANLVNYLNFKSDQVLVGRFLSTERLGVYSIGDRIASLTTNEMVGPLKKAIFPGLSTLKSEPAQLHAAYTKAQIALIAIMLPVGIGTAMIANEIVLVIAGRAWADAAIVVQFLAPVMAVGLLNTAVAPLVMVVGQTHLIFYRSLLNLAVRIPPVLIGFFVFGFVGLLWARVIAGLLNTYITLRLASQVTRAPWFQPVLGAWRSLLSTLLMVVALVMFTTPVAADASASDATASLVLKACLGAGCYVLSHYLLWLLAGRPTGLESFVGGILRERIVTTFQRMTKWHTV